MRFFSTILSLTGIFLATGALAQERYQLNTEASSEGCAQEVRVLDNGTVVEILKDARSGLSITLPVSPKGVYSDVQTHELCMQQSAFDNGIDTGFQKVMLDCSYAQVENTANTEGGQAKAETLQDVWRDFLYGISGASAPTEY